MAFSFFFFEIQLQNGPTVTGNDKIQQTAFKRRLDFVFKYSKIYSLSKLGKNV